MTDLEPTAVLPNGTKIYNVRMQAFEVSPNYRLKRVLGYGAYGTVCSAIDDDTGSRVAIKRVSNVFQELHSGKRALREMEIMTTMNHTNLIRLHRFIRPQNRESFEDIYLIMDLFDTDLHRIIKSGQALTEEHCQYFMIQAFRGLNYLHSARIMHRDLKPSNLLVNENCTLAICDFGLARDDQIVAPADLTQYVVTRWYRPPEVLGMGSNMYTNAVDVWSLGLIFAELIVGRTVLPGTDYIGQLTMIVSLLGTPSAEDMQILSPEAQRFLRTMPPRPARPFRELFPTAPPAACDLLSQLLVFHPDKRLTAKQVIEHAYFTKYRDPAEETEASQAFASSDGRLNSKEDLRDQFWRLITAHSTV